MPERPDTPPGDASNVERSRGLAMETCYRHPNEQTGVHCTRCNRPICPECMTQAPVGYQCPNCVAEAAAGRPRMRVRFAVGRPTSIVTVLLAANVLMFVIELATGASSLLGGGNSQRLFDLGALFPQAVAQGHQYWRLLTVMFLHDGIIHLALNMYGLYLLGYLMEQTLGSAKFTALYFVSGFLASTTTFVFSNPNTLAVGASGAIFGLLGAWVAYNYRRRGSPIASANLRMALMLIVLNLVIGFSIAGIDNYAHIGGLVAGVVAEFFIEGFGSRQTRRVVGWAGMAGMVLVGVVLVVMRTTVLGG